MILSFEDCTSQKAVTADPKAPSICFDQVVKVSVPQRYMWAAYIVWWPMLQGQDNRIAQKNCSGAERKSDCNKLGGGIYISIMKK